MPERFMRGIEAVNGIVWGPMGLGLLFGTGLLLTVRTGGFQLRRWGYWMRHTLGAILTDRSVTAHTAREEQAISQFQSLCTALASTIGTGNLVGVATAILSGGAGAVFWMWVMALLGMMTSYAENVLGIYYRRRNSQGEWSGGAMYYLKDGLGGKKHCKTIGSVLAVLFSIFAILASFGIGNMGQINKIVLNMKSAFFGGVTATVGGMSVVSLACGIVLMILAALIVIGGLQRIATVAERVVPFMAVLYIIGSLIVFFTHISSVGAMFAAIFRFAFGSKAVAGGAAGIAIQQAITQGCKRGVFSNEAGLGSSVMVHSSSNVKEPVAQGMWGIFEVFFDTFVVCTMTAIVVLSSGYIDLETGLAVAGVDDATLVARAFGNVFGPLGEKFVALAMLLFAFTTVLGWSQYGTKAVEYLFGEKATKIYKVIFVVMILSGAVMTSSLAWDISDTFNGLMMLPNLIGVVVLCPMVMKITKNYVNRKIKGIPEEPVLSHFPDIQAEAAASQTDEV